MIKSVEISAERGYNSITFKREVGSDYVEMQFHYSNGCRFAEFSIKDMMHALDMLVDMEEYKALNGKTYQSESQEEKSNKRCKDCPNWKLVCDDVHRCMVFDWVSKPDDFCSFESEDSEG